LGERREVSVASEIDHGTEVETDAEVREVGGSADLRRYAEKELRLAEKSDLPMVREKHLLASRRWAAMAADRERSERRRESAGPPQEGGVQPQP
jgi:hypothetical protein